MEKGQVIATLYVIVAFSGLYMVMLGRSSKIAAGVVALYGSAALLGISIYNNSFGSAQCPPCLLGIGILFYLAMLQPRPNGRLKFSMEDPTMVSPHLRNVQTPFQRLDEEVSLSGMCFMILGMGGTFGIIPVGFLVSQELLVIYLCLVGASFAMVGVIMVYEVVYAHLGKVLP